MEGSIYEAGSSAPSKKPKQNPRHLLRPGNHTSNPGVIPKRTPCGCLSLAADDPQEYCVNSDHPSSTGQHRCVNCGFLACQLCRMLHAFAPGNVKLHCYNVGRFNKVGLLGRALR